MAGEAARAEKWRRYYERLPVEFWQRVDQSAGNDGCWPYKGSRRSNGYGRLRIHGKYELAHRVAYRFQYGVEPGRLVVMHKCDNPCCCNPRHLLLGTMFDNMRDCSAKGRSPLHRAKLRPHHAQEIAARLAMGETGAALAREFNVSATAISRIRTGRTWSAALRARA